MKKTRIAIAALAVLCLLFCGLWLYEKNDRSDLETACQNAAISCLRKFETYEASGNEGDYWYAVAEFNVFLRALLTEKDGGDTDYLYCNIVYGEMVLNPEGVKAELSALLEALRILAEDYTHPNAYLRMASLGNELRYGE